MYKAVGYVAYVGSLSEPARATLLLWAPRLTQAVFAALGDFYTWRLATKLYGEGCTASSAAVCTRFCVGAMCGTNLSQVWMTALNPWQWYCSVRTFSNSLETTLTIAALNQWPWQLVEPAKSVKENPKVPGATLSVHR